MPLYKKLQLKIVHSNLLLYISLSFRQNNMIADCLKINLFLKLRIF